MFGYLYTHRMEKARKLLIYILPADLRLSLILTYERLPSPQSFFHLSWCTQFMMPTSEKFSINPSLYLKLVLPRE